MVLDSIEMVKQTLEDGCVVKKSIRIRDITITWLSKENGLSKEVAVSQKTFRPKVLH